MQVTTLPSGAVMVTNDDPDRHSLFDHSAEEVAANPALAADVALHAILVAPKAAPSKTVAPRAPARTTAARAPRRTHTAAGRPAAKRTTARSGSDPGDPDEPEPPPRRLIPLPPGAHLRTEGATS